MVVVKEGPYYQAEQAASAQNNGSSSSTTSNGTSSSGNSSTTSNTSNMEPKQEYNYIENKCGQEAETAGYLEILRRRITELENGKLENDHVTLFLTSAIPKITKSLLKHRFMDDDLGANVHNFYKQVLHLVANYIQNGTIVSYPGLLTAMTHIFDNDNNYYLSKGKPSMEEQDQFAVFPTNNKWASYWLVELVEFFGRRGGYDIVLDFLKSLTVPAQSIENSSTGNNTPQQPVKSSLPLVIALLEPLWNIIHNGYFVPEVLGSHMERIQGVVLPYLMGVSNDELKQFKKDELDALFKLLNKMLEAVYPVGQVGEIMEKFQLDFALKCFLSPIFDKRIYGLGYINDVIGLLRHTNKEQTSTSPKDTDNATSHALVVYQPPAAPPLPKDTRWIDAPFLVNWLQRNQLVELIFGKSAQPVILQKSGDIFGFLGKNDALSRDQIDMIWKCATTVHEAFLPILFKVIGDNCGDLQISHVQQLYECLQSIPRNTLTSIYLQLLRDFSKGVADSDQRLMCMNLLYDIMVDQTPTTGPPLDISQLAMYHLSELVKQQVFRPHRHAWLAKCIQNVRQNVSVAFCLDLMGQIFSSYPPKPPSKDSIPSNGSNGTNTNAPLAGTADGASTSSNNGTSGTSSQPVENVSVVDIIKKIEKEFSFFDLFFEELVNFKNTAVTNVANVNRDQYDPNTLVLSGRLDYISEVKTRLRLLLFVLNHYETILDYEKYEIVWDNLIVRAVTYLEYDECFQWFISARVEPYPNALVAIDDKNASLLFKNKMLKISTVGATSLAFKCVQRYFLDANIKDKKIEWKDIKEEDFEVLDLDLVGYSFIWDILLNVYNLDVVTACSEFLVKIQTKISPKVVEKVGKKKLREQFVTLCLNYLQRSADGAIKASVDGATNDVERRSERCLSLLIAFCDQCQVEAGYKIKSHGTSTRGKPIKLLFLNSVLNSYPAAFSVSTHTNEQISTIKARVKDIINYQGPLKHLYFSIQRVSIPLADESKSLHDLKIHSTASSFDYSQTSDTSNIYPNNRYVITVHEIPHLPKGQETVNRSRAGNGSPKVEKKDPADAAEKAKQLMEVGGITETAALVALRRADWDVNAGVLLLTDEQQRKEIVEEAEKLAEEASLTETNKGPIDEKVLQELPSYILSHSEEFFNQIFKLLNLNNESISNKVWHLLLSMPTSKSTLETIHAIGREDSRIDWDSLFDIKSSYKLLYILQIIDTTIFAVEDSLSSDSRVKWCNQFLAKGGFLQLYKILSTQDWFAAPKLSHSQDKTNTEAAIQQKSCLALILKILDFFLHAVIDKGLDYRNNEDAFVIQIKQSHVSFSGMLDHVDSAATIEKLLMIVWNCASKAVPDVDDAVVTYAMRLIVLLILSDPSKLSVLYNYKSFDTFVLRTILECREFSIRSAAAEGFYQLCAHVIVPSGKVSTPHSYFLKLLLNNMPDHMSTNYNVWATCGQYFHLLDRLIDDACSGKDGENPKKYQDLLVQLVHFLKQRPIVELRNSDIVDEILIGLISLITTLVRHEPSFRFLVGQQHGLVQELYHNGLFGLKAGPSSSSPPKCKARLSRIYAFQLLVELGKNQENYAQLLTLLEGHHGGGTRVATWEYHPSADDKPTNGYVGLRNLGNTCYINSLFQQFFMMPSVRDGFLHIEEPGTDKEKKESLAYQIQNIFGYLQESEKASFDPAGFCAAYKDWEGRPTNVHQQQDVDEFFKILWQRLEGQLKGTQHEKLLTNVFGGKMCTELRSVEKEYPYVSEREEDFITLSLDIKGKPNIEAALDAFVKADKLEGDNAYFCEQYQRKVDATTRCYIKKLTNTVILHLKRFDFDFTNYKKNKVNDYCEFPLFLNMKPWTKDGIGQKELGEMTDNTDPEYAYELMGVLVHSGGADAGHYYSYIKERDAKFGERKWFEFNDKVVSDFNIQDLAGECFGGTQLVTHWDNWSRQYVKRTYDRVRSAYMLFYDKVKVENSPVQSNQVPDPKIDTSFITNLTTAANQSQEAPQDHPTFINGVPYNIYKHVWTENAEFLRDRQLFDATYFDFMLQLSKIANVTPVTEYTIDPNSLSDDPTFRAIKLGTRFVFETLAHAKENDTYFHWIEQLKSLYQIHVPACKWLLNHLMRGSLLHDLLLECSIERIRFGAADLIGHVLRTLVPYEHPFYFEVEEALKVTDSATGAVSIAPVGSVATEGPDAPKTELVKVPRALTVLFMDNVFSLLEESRNYWRRFKQYFRVIRDFASISHYQRQYFISRQLVSVYAEYFMGKTKKGQTKRANVMDRFNLPDLVEFIDALSVIVRGCETGALKEKGYPPTTVNDGVVLQLPNREKKELWDKTFFTSMLEMDYNTRGATEIIIHSSWEDLKRTKWVMDLLLGEISKSWMSDKFAVFEALLTPLILLQDSLQNTRIIMALSPFGSPGSPKGVLAIIHELHAQNAKYVLMLIKFLMHLATNPAVASYLSKQAREMMWIEQFLESKVGNATGADEEMGTSDDTETVDVDATPLNGDPEVIEYGPHLPGSNGTSQKSETRPRRDSIYVSYVSVKKFLQEHGVQQEPNFDKERELVEEIDSLKRENARLKEALEYYRQKAPDVKPPTFMTTKEWEQGRTNGGGKIRIDEDDQDDESRMDDGENQMEMETISTAVVTTVTSSQPQGESQLSPEIQEKVAQLTAIFSNVPEQIAILALKKMDNDVENAAFLLSDDISITELMKEASEADATSNPNKKQKTSSPEDNKVSNVISLL